MKYYGGFAALVLIFAFQSSLAGCNLIHVHNDTKIGIHAYVSYPGGGAVLSPDPGSYSEIEANGNGSFTVTASPAQDWVDYAKTASKVLNDQLNDPAKLSPDQVRGIQQRLNDFRSKIQSYETAAAGTLASCTGTIKPQQETPLFGLEEFLPSFSVSLSEVTIIQDAGGNLVATCQ
jgi:hypothetical protein